MYNQGPPFPPHPPHPPHPPQGQYGYGPPPQQVIYVQAPPAVMVKPPFNHTPHLVIDFLSCGAWLPFHLIIWACH